MPKLKSNEEDTITLTIGDCVLKRTEAGAEIMLKNGKAFSITIPESYVLTKLVEGNGEVVTKDNLIIEGWGRVDIIGPNSLPVAITNLRKVLELVSVKIINVPRKGYRIYLPKEKNGKEDINLVGSGVTTVADERYLLPLKWEYILKISCITLVIIILMYFLIFIGYSWVWVKCNVMGEIKVCYIVGNAQDIEIVQGKQGFSFYFDHS